MLLVNTERLAPADFPDSFDDLVGPSIPGAQVGMAYPVFGTAATHAAALYAALGADEARARFGRIADAGVRIVDGNAVVRDLVVSGELAYGITDTDDACGAVERGAPVEIVVPDQAPGRPGTLVIPNTVALVAGAPHPDQARALVDRLLAPETERQLLASGWFQLSLRGDAPAGGCDVGPVRGMDVGLLEVAGEIERAKADMAEIFVR